MSDPISHDQEPSLHPDENTHEEQCLQPFQFNAKRELWDKLYGTFFKLEIEKEKEKIDKNKKQPRKPLSPYIFFSQEMRKTIKKENNLSAKAIMKQVSKSW